MNLIIRPSRDEDVPALAAFYAASVKTETASWEYEVPDLAEFTRRRADILAKGYPYLVAELNGKPVGYSYASAFRARVGYRFVVEDSIYVDPAAKGQGIGKKLLLALIDECTQLGYRQMVAVIGESDNVRAQSSCMKPAVSSRPHCSRASVTSSAAGWTAYRCSGRWVRGLVHHRT